MDEGVVAFEAMIMGEITVCTEVDGNDDGNDDDDALATPIVEVFMLLLPLLTNVEGCGA